jgi:hypothetical protein
MRHSHMYGERNTSGQASVKTARVMDEDGSWELNGLDQQIQPHGQTLQIKLYYVSVGTVTELPECPRRLMVTFLFP